MQHLKGEEIITILRADILETDISEGFVNKIGYQAAFRRKRMAERSG
jgi:hypothetical protein